MAIACKQCAAELEESTAVCSHCGTAVSVPEPAPIQAQDSSPEQSWAPTFSTGNDLEGIGGWLILVAIGLAIGPFTLLYGVFTDLQVFFGARFQAGLAHLPGLTSLILFEAVSNTIFLFALIVLNVMFYGKKRAFPRLMIAYLAFNCVVILIDHFGALRYNPHAGSLAVLRSVVGTFVWIPYYVVSERVKATFVQ
jgi:hypothetical protein